MTAGENGGLAAGGTTPPAKRPGRRTIVAVAGAAALVLAGGGLALALSSSHGNNPASAAVRQHVAKPAPALHVLSVTPGSAARGVNGAAPVTVKFSTAVNPHSVMPSFTPHVAGTWSQAKATVKVKGTHRTKTVTEADTLVFTPTTAFQPDSTVTLNVPAGPDGVKSTAGGMLTAEVTSKFHTGSYSLLRLQQLLAQQGYLPLTWTATGSSATSTSSDYAAAYQAPAGTFTWQSGYPAILHSMWSVGTSNEIDYGAIWAFEYNHGMATDGVAGPRVWKALLAAEASGAKNPDGYTYALASKVLPETLTIWHNGHIVLHTLANTGAAGVATANGTWPVYEKLPYQVMKGTNPDGSHYADPVVNVNYFHGGDAVHYFDRGSYGWPQSLGCVELPMAASKTAYQYLSYGSLVTVSPNVKP